MSPGLNTIQRHITNSLSYLYGSFSIAVQPTMTPYFRGQIFYQAYFWEVKYLTWGEFGEVKYLSKCDPIRGGMSPGLNRNQTHTNNPHSYLYGSFSIAVQPTMTPCFRVQIFVQAYFWEVIYLTWGEFGEVKYLPK